MKDRSDDPSRYERTLLPRSYISLLSLPVTSPLCVEAAGNMAIPRFTSAWFVCQSFTNMSGRVYYDRKLIHCVMPNEPQRKAICPVPVKYHVISFDIFTRCCPKLIRSGRIMKQTSTHSDTHTHTHTFDVSAGLPASDSS